MSTHKNKNQVKGMEQGWQAAQERGSTTLCADRHTKFF